MLNGVADERFESWLLGEIGRARKRVRDLRVRYPTASPQELARRLIDRKVRWAAAGGAAGGLVGLAAIPAGGLLRAYLQMSLLVDLAVLSDRNLKSARAREELWELFRSGRAALRARSEDADSWISRMKERIVTTRGVRILSRMVPVLGAPVRSVMEARDLRALGVEALRYFEVPRAVLQLKARR